MVTVNEQEELLFAASVAVTVTVEVPSGNVLPDAGTGNRSRSTVIVWCRKAETNRPVAYTCPHSLGNIRRTLRNGKLSVGNGNGKAASAIVVGGIRSDHLYRCRAHIKVTARWRNSKLQRITRTVVRCWGMV